MKIIPLRTRKSSTRGLPWLLGKNGRSRAICSSVSQKRLLILPPHILAALNHAGAAVSSGSLGPELSLEVIDRLALSPLGRRLRVPRENDAPDRLPARGPATRATLALSGHCGARPCPLPGRACLHSVTVSSPYHLHGSGMKVSGGAWHSLQMNCAGVRPLRVFRLRALLSALLSASMKSARWFRSWSWSSWWDRLTVASLIVRFGWLAGVCLQKPRSIRST